MTDDDFLAALEHCQLPATEFNHVSHVRAAYLYLRAGGFAQALEKMRSSIGNYATHLGKPEKYHETITVAYLALIQEHISNRGDAGGWIDFRRHNPELFEPDLLLQYYGKEQLDSDLARRTFVLPRHASGAVPQCK
jgi:hypothetical protein